MDRKILVVDDEVTILMLLREAFERRGYEVVTAQSGEEALEKTKQGKYSLLIVDVEMPGINGFELIQTLKNTSEYSEIPTIIVSSLGGQEMKRKGIEAGAEAYIVKGEFDQNEFLETIESLL